MKYWKLTVLAMTAITASSPAQNAGNHNPAFSVPNTFIGGEPYIFIGENDNQVFPHRTPVELKYRDAAPEGGRTGITTLTWSSGGDKVDSYNFKPEGGEDGSIGVIDGDGQGNGEKDGGDDRKWTWNGDAEQQNYDGKIIYLQGKTAASSGDPATLKAFHKEKPDDPEEDAFEREFTLLKVDLDVNNDGDVTDAVDGLENYLPGYEGDDAKLHSGTTFEAASYSGAQAVRLVLGVEIQNAKFKIKDVTDYDGYCVNGFEGLGSNSDDFSFDENSDDCGEIDATVANGETSAVLYCKDYGAACTVEIIVDGTTIIEVKVPEDTNSNKLADSWEEQQVDDWFAQYGNSLSSVLGSILIGLDGEMKDPDGSGALHSHNTTGDGLSILKEYRGFITDFGPNHTGGHKRFSAAKKELLVEVSEMDGIQPAISAGENPNNVTYSLQNLQSSISDLYANQSHGVGVDVYWAKDTITNLGGLVDYNGNNVIDSDERSQAHLWEDVVEKSNGNNNIGGGSYVRSDRKLQILDSNLHGILYDGPTGDPDEQKVFLDNRNPDLEDFVKLALLTRWGQVKTDPSNLPSGSVTVTTPVVCNVELVGPAISKTSQPDHTSEGALVAVTGLAEEAIENLQDGGGHFSVAEFDNVLSWAVAHEVGHLLVGPSHPGVSSTALMAVPPGPQRDGITVTNLESGEMQEMDFKDKASVDE